jgi:hypothetical protein
MSRLIITAMRNEAPFILEWIAWHRMIGFDHFLIHTNDCTDPTDDILKRLMTLGIVTWRQNTAGVGQAPQRTALKDAMTHDLYKAASWAAHIDVDEFIMIHAGRGHLDDMFAAMGDVNMISLPWRNFGSSGIHTFSPGLVTETFEWAAPRYILQPWQLTAIKTLHRPLGHWRAIGPHRPYDLKALPSKVRWVGGAGQPMPKEFLQKGWRSHPGYFGDSIAQINHYAIKSAESFLVKSDRGAPIAREWGADFQYWCLRDINFEKDSSMAKHIPALKEAMADLLNDPELSQLHFKANESHRTAIARLRERSDIKELFDKICSYKPTGGFATFRDGEKVVYDFTIPEVPDFNTSR